MTGPLAGVRVVEMSGIGPGPFGTMVLADLGADVIRVERRSGGRMRVRDPLARSRRSIAVDLKQPEGRDIVAALVARADVLVDPFRPGVMERNGLGPEVCCAANARLVYARMTGWGQDGPYAPKAGHDINYIALAGALEGLGRAGGPPTPPQNLLGDFGGGGMLLAVGVLAALVERGSSGRGQVLDVAIVDGAALLTAFVRGFVANGLWDGGRGENRLDTGAHFYEVYETADGKFVSVGTVEEKFYDRLLSLLGGVPELEGRQLDASLWADRKVVLAAIFRSRTRDEWCDLLEDDLDACFAPVLSLDDAPRHPHLVERGTYVEVDGRQQPAPAPRFSRSDLADPVAGPVAGAHSDEILAELGYPAGAIEALREQGVLT